jgi:hypothetical protein
MLEQAELYLAKVIPWPQEGDEPAYVNIHWTSQSPGFNKPRWNGRACLSVQDATSAIKWVQSLADARDIYVCMSTQREMVEKISKAGFAYRDAVRNQQNAVALKSLFIDLDAKGLDKNSYATPDDALQALMAFLKASGMPPPSLIVASGGGYHCYWTLVPALAPDDWKPLAHALAEATKQFGLKCDTQCTIDSARVLRVPDTLNRKTDPGKPVRIIGTPRGDYLVSYIEQILAPYKAVLPAKVTVTSSPLPPRPPIPGVSPLAAGIEIFKAPLINLDEIAKECPFVNEAIATGGKDYGNPLWNITTFLSTFTEGQEDDAHRMAKAHKDYARQSTQELFERKEREKARSNLGWPSCAAISGSGSKHCQSCRHFPLGRTPFHPVWSATQRASAPMGGTQGVVPAGSVPQPDDVPDGYRRDAQGLVSKVVRDDSGADQLTLISNYPMTDPWLQEDPSRLHFTTTTQRGKDRHVFIDTEVINGQGMRTSLQLQGFMLPEKPTGVTAVGRFLMSWVEKLQKTRDSVTTQPFGWDVADGGVVGFSFGGRLWTPTGDKQATGDDRVLTKKYQPTGHRSHWDTAAKLIFDQGRPDLEVILASAFAAPLMKFTGHRGTLLSVYSSESGIGKTTALNTAAAVWGRPKTTVQMLDDTGNSVMNSLGRIRSLPLYWDELKTEDQHRKFVSLTFQVTGGRERARLTQKITQRETGEWETLFISASNDSLLDFVVKNTSTTPAGLYRIFEYEVAYVPPTAAGQILSSKAQLITAKLEENHSHVGLDYAKFLGANHAAVEADLERDLAGLEAELKIDREERHWNSLIATLLAGARYANQLNITKFDEPAMKKFLAVKLDGMRKERKERPIDMNQIMSVSAIFSQFLNDMRTRHTLVTNKVHISRGKPAKGSIVIRNDTTKLDAIHVHVGKEDKILRISSMGLGEWLTDKGYSRHRFMIALEREFGFKKTDGILGSGTEMACAKQYLLEVDLAGTTHINFIDEL